MTLFQHRSLLFDSFREMGKAADAAAAQAAAKKRELDVVLSDSQKMKVVPCSISEHCSILKLPHCKCISSHMFARSTAQVTSYTSIKQSR
jgi:hypothetical protein